MFRPVYCIVFLILLTWLIFPKSSYALSTPFYSSGATLAISPSQSSCNVGEEIDVDVILTTKDSNRVTRTEVIIDYNYNIISIGDPVTGTSPPFTVVGATSQRYEDVINTTNFNPAYLGREVYYLQSNLPSDPLGFSGSSTIATLTITCLSEGTSDLHLTKGFYTGGTLITTAIYTTSDVVILDTVHTHETGDFVNGTVTVSNTVSPTPTSTPAPIATPTSTPSAAVSPTALTPKPLPKAGATMPTSLVVVVSFAFIFLGFLFTKYQSET